MPPPFPARKQVALPGKSAAALPATGLFAAKKVWMALQSRSSSSRGIGTKVAWKVTPPPSCRWLCGGPWPPLLAGGQRNALVLDAAACRREGDPSDRIWPGQVAEAAQA